MAITATNEGSGSNFEPIAAGNYIARCYSMVHIGTVEESINGKTKTMNKVYVKFELPTELKEFKEGEGEKPLSIGKEFNLSMNEKATLRKVLEGWRGKAFTEEQAKSFDVTVLLGKPCMLNVIHKTTKAGKPFAEISGISPMPKGIEAPPQFNPNFEFNYTPFDQEKFSKIPEWMQKKMKTSSEYISATGQTPPLTKEQEDRLQAIEFEKEQFAKGNTNKPDDELAF